MDGGREHKRRAFSGVQPTGNLHLGNYLGAVKRFVEMQEGEGETIYCVVDLHAMTMPYDPKALTQATRELTAAFLACGLDPARSILFNQSQVPEHAELAWVFNCVGRIGWLNRMTQFKDKAGKNRENASVGIYVYPCLMAADILAYQALPMCRSARIRNSISNSPATLRPSSTSISTRPISSRCRSR